MFFLTLKGKFLEFFDFLSASFRRIKGEFLKTKIEAQEQGHTDEQEAEEGHEIRCDGEWKKDIEKKISNIYLQLNDCVRTMWGIANHHKLNFVCRSLRKCVGIHA